MGQKPGKEASAEGSTEVRIEELAEFLEADRREVRADPDFKERLREQLWALIQQGRRHRQRGRR